MPSLPKVRIARIEAFPLRAKGGTSPNMALGQMPERPALLLRVEDEHGAFGWGEIWANFPPRAALHKAHLVEDVLAGKTVGLVYEDPREVNEALRGLLSTYFLHVGQQRVFEHLLAGLDVALWDLSLRVAGRSAKEHFGITDARPAVYASSVNPGDTQLMIDRHTGFGETFFKLKLGFGTEQDIGFVRDTADLLPEGAGFGVDPNQVWSRESARRVIAAIAPFRPAFVEEPIPADQPLQEWEALARWSDIPLAGGENIYGIDEFLRFASAGLTLLQPDVAKWGGLSGSLDLLHALPDGVRLWPHFMGTAVGQMAALTVTAVTGQSSKAEMDVNSNALRTDLCGPVLETSEGCVMLPTGPGLVAPPLEDQLASYQDDYILRRSA